MRAFLSTFHRYRVADSVLCCAFPGFLQEGALEWFWALEPESVNSLIYLVGRFLHQFCSSQSNVSTLVELLADRRSVFD